MREKVEDEAVELVSTEEERDAARALSSEAEDWMLEEGYEASLETLADKKQVLADAVSRLTARVFEYEHRSLVEERAVTVLEQLNETLEEVRVNHTWVTDVQREEVQNKSASFLEWWANATEAQAARTLHEDPAYSVVDVDRRLSYLVSEGKRLMRTVYIPKPAPKPAPEDDFGSYSSFYENLRKNFSNTTNWSGFNFSDINFTEFAKNFSKKNFSNFSANDSAKTDTVDNAEL